MTSLYLASGSPRRRELLALLDVPFEVLSIEVDEHVPHNEHYENAVLRLAREKALAGVSVSPLDLPVLGADTIVVVDDMMLGKPTNPQQARAMLRQLSGRSHWVFTAIAIASSSIMLADLVKTRVFFSELTDQEIEAYISTTEPMDKAGAYGIQGYGGVFVKRIEGSYHAVVGLPLVETKQLLDDYHRHVVSHLL